MERGDIDILEKHIGILEKEVRALEDGFVRKDKKTVSVSKHNMKISQRKIREVLQ